MANYYLKRAIVAQVGLGTNLPEDAIYPLNLGDESGKPLDGANKYTLHFEKGETPLPRPLSLSDFEPKFFIRRASAADFEPNFFIRRASAARPIRPAPAADFFLAAFSF
jgi:hypothetical protein